MPTEKKEPKPNENEFISQRQRLVEYLRGTHAIQSESVARAFLRVPRELFLSKENIFRAYEDIALPTQHGQTISQPTTIAHMLELLSVKDGMNILEVGSGCGYVLALLSHLVGENGTVYGMELEKDLVPFSQEKIKELELKNVEIMQGDGALGWEEYSPFDRVLVSAAVPFIPPALFKQLKEKGHIIAPVGDSFSQRLEKMAKFNGKILKREMEGNWYEFVPLKSKTFKP